MLTQFGAAPRLTSGSGTALPRGALLGRSDAPSSGAATPRPSSPATSGNAGTRPTAPATSERGDDAGDALSNFLRFSAGEKLSAQEVRELRPKLIEAIMGTGDSIDDLLTRTNRQHAEAQIWDMDETEATTLADTMLMLGRKSAVAAGAVRQVAQGYITVRAVLILLPRVIATAKWYPEHGGVGL